MSIHLDISVEEDAWDGLFDIEALVERAVSQTMARLGFSGHESELSLVFTNDEEIRAINAQWRAKDKPTNVLSFPAFPVAAGEKPGPMLGDIVIALETVQREADLERKSVSDHVTHLVIHGLLHLLGYDHENDTDAELMEGLEREVLAALGISDPYDDEGDL